MGYKMKRGNSGVKFKNLGSSPAKMHKPGHEGEARMLEGTTVFGKTIPEIKKGAKKIIDASPGGRLVNKAKKTYNKYKGKKAVKKSPSTGASEAISEKVTKGLIKGGKMGLKQSMKKIARPAKKKLMRKVRSDIKMKPPYKRPVGPRATPKTLKKETPGDVSLSPGFEDPKKIQKVQRKGLVPGSQTFTKKKKKTYPKSYTKEDIRFLEEQHEDIVRPEDKS